MDDQLWVKLKAALAKGANDRANGMGFFPAAVFIPLVERENGLSVLFEVRAGQLNWQPGEVCFPGGRVEPMDVDSQATAVRETSEELGIDPRDICVLGEMNEVVSPIGVILKPYVGRIAGGSCKLSKNEVAEVFAVPLDFLLTAEPLVAHMEMGNRPLEDFPFSLVPGYHADWMKRRTYEVLFYQYNGRVIWGLTAQVLADFLSVWRQALDIRQ